jgi:CubicO group peptidase (beta-lactamase class C family)
VSPPTLAALIARIAEEAEQEVATRPEATLILGVTRGGERHVVGFRSPDAKEAAMPHADSIYEIGSVSKTFSNTVLAVLDDRGVLSLDDPIGKHLTHLQLRPEVAAVTLRDIATHSSGLPDLGQRHLRLCLEEVRGTLAPFGAYTHYLRYTKEHLYADLEDAELVYPTGQGWAYSVFAMGTLGHILELVTGERYEDLLRATVCEPLGLADTFYTISDGQPERVIFAYDSDGQPLPNWYHDVLMSQGGLRSTINDLLTYAEANINATNNPDGSPLSNALRKTREVHFTTPEGTKNTANTSLQGLAWWGIDGPDGRGWWHGGQTLFYCSTVGVVPDSDLGFVLLRSHHRLLADAAGIVDRDLAWFRRVRE